MGLLKTVFEVNLGLFLKGRRFVQHFFFFSPPGADRFLAQLTAPSCSL